MNIAVVVLNWNGKALLEKYLPSVLTHSAKAKVYVADNGSTDESLEFLSQQYPEVVVLKNMSNLGFAGGYNKALNNVEEDIYVLLNNDVEVTKGWLSPFLKLFASNTSIAAIQPKIKSIQQPNNFDYAGAAGGFIDALGYPFCRGRIFDSIEEDTGQYDTEIEVFWASGACLAIRKECFRLSDGFDESYFAHQEEIDLCWRLKNLGFTIMYTYKSKVFHQGGGTLSNSSPHKTFLNFRNSLCSILKNSERNPYPILFVRLLLDGIAALRFLTQGKFSHFFAIFKSHISFYTKFIDLIHKRHQLQKKKQIFVVKSIVWHSFVLKTKKYSRLKMINK
ncbi:glycosyltransferase family 2 protein [Psychroflexus sp. MES1-P1E]|uniref:glycosyltransferase family 2 protein n=1 Tax=Psychroflexus sp. MES1-P1E TaxID=2058320 RepID=UPI000C7E2920|nr:glycosyltransferase family 2 protein [Psychroflexus sp. MES1-P1E]PKG41761.1 dTDP-Rha--alpha-D-GlcNAc-pyrophosphate polyprenol alpha-3-L-rhamnosyltransferase [Psychroflexus sp. MES1-P1E]